MTTTKISIADLQALLDVAEGYTCEAGLDAAGKYAVPKQVEQAITNAHAAIRKAKA